LIDCSSLALVYKTLNIRNIADLKALTRTELELKNDLSSLELLAVLGMLLKKK